MQVCGYLSATKGLCLASHPLFPPKLGSTLSILKLFSSLYLLIPFAESREEGSQTPPPVGPATTPKITSMSPRPSILRKREPDRSV